MPAWWTWLLAPISGAQQHDIAAVVAWHGRVMVLCWGLVVPMAVLAARFFKVTARQQWPRALDNKAWWHVHRISNYFAVFGTCAAVLLVWGADSYASAARGPHAGLGWTLTAFGLLQVFGAQLRGSKGGPTAPRRGDDGRILDLRGDHYHMTPRRRWFERVHKMLGYAALLLAVITILFGLWTADAPRWMWLVLLGWWILWMFAFSYLQRRGRCLDTYQAIWGPSLEHPGNRVPPVGWGIRRVADTADTAQQ